MDNRRKEMRKKVMAFSPVHDLDRGTLLGYLGNVTLEGAMVVGEKALEINSHVILSIDLPGDLTNITARQMNIQARVARCVQDEYGPREFNIGFEFIKVDLEQAKIFNALLERYHFLYEPYA